MDWVWALYRKYIIKSLKGAGLPSPTEAEIEAAFLKSLAQSTITVLVQEPWMNSVRFKGLHRAPVAELTGLVNDPMNWLFERYGGGKFKLNFHEGWNFVATQNFKPEGEPKWKDMPGIEF
ncbi:MAG: hypothetical protein OXI38_01960 [Bacteroidota bacterium]|nr:hypothetical protein [Bacteroidota bacterium]